MVCELAVGHRNVRRRRRGESGRSAALAPAARHAGHLVGFAWAHKGPEQFEVRQRDGTGHDVAEYRGMEGTEP